VPVRILIFGNSGSGRSTLARELAREHGRSRDEQDAMLETLQEWVKGYYSRSDPWSYRTHRRIFDAFEGRKIERTQIGALPS
jgi:predicted kinase